MPDKLPSIRMPLERGGKTSREFATYLEKIKQDATSSPTFATVTLTDLTASLPVVTDASKNLVSETYAAFMASLSGQAAEAFSFNDQALTGVGAIGCGDVTTTGDYLLANGNYVGISGAERLEFYTAGKAAFMGCNVGFGTVNPGRKVEIYAATAVLRLRDSGATANACLAYVEFGGTDGGNWSRTGFVGDSASANANIKLEALVADLLLAADDDIILTPGGTGVGIGTESPGTLLDVSGTSEIIRITDKDTDVGDQHVIGEFQVYGSDPSSGGAGVRTSIKTVTEGVSGNYNSLTFSTSALNAAPVEAMRIFYDGNVGIGVADPDTKLEILNAGNQLKLSFDGTDNAVFGVDTTGVLTITPSGTGVNIDNIYAGGHPWFDVMHYGATGDGSTDDTSAIQDAIDACIVADGGIVFFPVGTYLISSALNIHTTAKSVILQGANWQFSKIKAKNGINFISPMLHFDDDGSTGNVRSGTINMHIDGGHPNDSYEDARIGIAFDNCLSCFVDQCFIDGCYIGIRLGDSGTGVNTDKMRLTNIDFGSCYHCIYLPSQVETWIENIHADTPGDHTYRDLAFTGGGGGSKEISAKDILVGATSGTTVDVLKVTVDTGSWAGGNAAGSLIILQENASFHSSSENLNIQGGDSDVATIAGESVSISIGTVIYCSELASTDSYDSVYMKNIAGFKNRQYGIYINLDVGTAGENGRNHIGEISGCIFELCRSAAIYVNADKTHGRLLIMGHYGDLLDINNCIDLRVIGGFLNGNSSFTNCDDKVILGNSWVVATGDEYLQRDLYLVKDTSPAGGGNLYAEGGVRVEGKIDETAANVGYLREDAGGLTLLAHGPNATTRGTISLHIRESDQGNGITALSIANTGIVTFSNCLVDGTCEIFTEDALSIIADITKKGTDKFDEYGHERFDMIRLAEKYPYLFTKQEISDAKGGKTDFYGEFVGAKSDLLYRAAMQLWKQNQELRQRIEVLEAA